jgi:phosphoglycerate dehydrogenase-like enzyme
LNQPKICIYHPVDPSGEAHRALVEAGCELVVGNPGAAAAQMRQCARGAAALMGATYRAGLIDQTLMDAAPELRIISKYTIGFDDVDLDAATARGVLVTHCPIEANWGGVAEGTLAAMLALLKKLRERDRQVKSGGWRDPALVGTYLGARRDGYPGITVGLIGLGRIGSRVADLLAPWQVRILACDPHVDAAHFALHHAEPVTLDALLSASDVVSLHCNLNAQTRGMLGAPEFARMKPGAVLINTARGALIDIAALVTALTDGRLAAAALDVLPEEPPPTDSALLQLGDRILLSPHMVAANEGSPLRPAIAWAHQATLAALRGQLPERICNVEAIPRWRRRFEGHPLLPLPRGGLDT